MALTPSRPIASNASNKGTASGALYVSLPFTATLDGVMSGREVLVNGGMVTGTINVTQNYVAILYYNNTSVIQSGMAVMLNGLIMK